MFFQQQYLPAETESDCTVLTKDKCSDFVSISSIMKFRNLVIIFMTFHNIYDIMIWLNVIHLISATSYDKYLFSWDGCAVLHPENSSLNWSVGFKWHDFHRIIGLYIIEGVFKNT